MVGVSETVVATDPRFVDALGSGVATWEYRNNYGLNETLASTLSDSAQRLVARAWAGQVRALRLGGHPSFVGTLFQPGRRALCGGLHPPVRAFLDTTWGDDPAGSTNPPVRSKTSVIRN